MKNNIVSFVRKLCGTDRLVAKVDELERLLARNFENVQEFRETYFRIEMQSSDVLQLLIKNNPFPQFSVVAEAKIASDTTDHLHPRGTKNDNTRSPRFVYACEKFFDFMRPQLDFLDIGCAGGGLVLDFLLRGHNALGIEGSDYSLNMQRATWKHLGSKNLFTVDATMPYTIYDSNQSLFKADIISAWEFFEHIPENKINHVFSNVFQLLKGDGIFIGSISTQPDEDNGIVYHHTVRPPDWWRNVFRKNNFIMIENSNFSVDDFCRGSGNGALDWDVRKHPYYGFHFVAKKIQA